MKSFILLCDRLHLYARRAPVEADSETIRAAILLDELESSQPQQGLNAGRIIVEVKTLNALSVLQFSCSVRVMALHTGEMNARRSACLPALSDVHIECLLPDECLCRTGCRS